MALQVTQQKGTFDKYGRPEYYSGFSYLTFDTPDEETILALLTRFFGEGTLERTENEKKYVYSAGDKRYSVKVDGENGEAVRPAAAAQLPGSGSVIGGSSRVEGEYFIRMVDGRTPEITAYYGDGGDVTIPATLYGGKVKGIAGNAFKKNEKVRFVTIPEGIMRIGVAAFSHCGNLRGLSLPNSLELIGPEAFSYCDSLESVTIPDSVTEIGGWAFSSCGKLHSVMISRGVKILRDATFLDCKNLRSVTIPEGVCKIEDAAFCNCKSLRSVVIPDSTTRIGEYAFANCVGLRSLTIPESVETILSDAFRNCPELCVRATPGSWAATFCSHSGIRCVDIGGE